MKKHSICLSPEQRQTLHQMVKAGKAPARQILHAQMRLESGRERSRSELVE